MDPVKSQQLMQSSRHRTREVQTLQHFRHIGSEVQTVYTLLVF